MANSNFPEADDSLNQQQIPNRQAFVAMKKVADHQGIAKAQYFVGSSFGDGIWVSKSYKKAFYYFKLAADQGLSQAQASLALLYNEGLGVEKSPIKVLLHQSLTKGILSLIYLLGEFYAEGKGVAQSTKESIRYYHMAADWETLLPSLIS